MNTKWDAGAATPNSRLKKMIVLAAALVPVVSLVWWPGCRQYPPATSRENLDLVKLVYTACNTRSPKRLELARQRIERAASQRSLSPAEETAFRKILALATAGDWQAAEAGALRFANDQIGQGKH